MYIQNLSIVIRSVQTKTIDTSFKKIISYITSVKKGLACCSRCYGDLSPEGVRSA